MTLKSYVLNSFLQEQLHPCCEENHALVLKSTDEYGAWLLWLAYIYVTVCFLVYLPMF